MESPHDDAPVPLEPRPLAGVQIVEAIILQSKGETVSPQRRISTGLYCKSDAAKDPKLR